MRKGDIIVDHVCDHHDGCGYCAVLLSAVCHTPEDFRSLRQVFVAKNRVIRDLKKQLEELKDDQVG